jgi:hypothetical protein
MTRDWTNMSNTEIRMKMQTMEMEYESVKNKISVLIDELDRLDNEYEQAKKELNKRSK